MLGSTSLSSLLIIHLVVTLSRLVYYGVGIAMLISRWNRPFLKARVPSLVLITALGFVT